jgi:hypothetical protein
VRLQPLGHLSVFRIIHLANAHHLEDSRIVIRPLIFCDHLPAIRSERPRGCVATNRVSCHLRGDATVIAVSCGNGRCHLATSHTGACDGELFEARHSRVEWRRDRWCRPSHCRNARVCGTGHVSEHCWRGSGEDHTRGTVGGVTCDLLRDRAALAHCTTRRTSATCNGHRDHHRREGPRRNQNSVVTLERRSRSAGRQDRTATFVAMQLEYSRRADTAPSNVGA